MVKVSSIYDFKKLVEGKELNEPEEAYEDLSEVASDSQKMYALTNVMVCGEVMYASDGTVFAILPVSNENKGGKKPLPKSLPGKRSIDAHKTDDVELEIGGENVEVFCDHKIDQSGIYEREQGNYPDVPAVIPDYEQHDTISFNLSASNLRRLAQVIADSEYDNRVKLEFILKDSDEPDIDETKPVRVEGDKGFGVLMLRDSEEDIG